MAQDLNKVISKMGQVFKCFICLSNVRSTVMTPCCHKFCCYDCIEQWLNEHSSCPLCRSKISINDMIKAQTIDEIAEEFEMLEKKESEEICQKHQIQARYYCVTCQIPICSDCVIIDDQHKSDEIVVLDSYYQKQLSIIQEKITSLNQMAQYYQDTMNKIDQQLEGISDSFEQCKIKTEHAKDEILRRIEEKTKEKKEYISTARIQAKKSKEEIEKNLTIITKTMKQYSKSELIRNTEMILESLEKIQSPRANDTNLHWNQESQLLNEIVPEFDKFFMEIPQFSSYRHQCTEINSDVVNLRGQQWRLKVYPFGNSEEIQDEYISIFLELVKSSFPTLRYTYHIELIHPLSDFVESENTNFENEKNDRKIGNLSSNKEQKINMDISLKQISPKASREYSSDFQEGDSWGYSKFHRIHSIENEGFVSQDTLKIAFSLRPLTYFHKSLEQEKFIQDLKRNIEKVQNDNKILKNRIDQMNLNRRINSENSENLDYISSAYSENNFQNNDLNEIDLDVVFDNKKSDFFDNLDSNENELNENELNENESNEKNSNQKNSNQKNSNQKNSPLKSPFQNQIIDNQNENKTNENILIQENLHQLKKMKNNKNKRKKRIESLESIYNENFVSHKETLNENKTTNFELDSNEF
ncbi:e3 ubiquitin-protein ligase trim37 [Anaeramoeba ignava]|uniref:E3 ubiquitin-protein ligase trim37 n=1 Tax=Anaeramoeba ignava TaxID=1746090 RepID=A0A9Q0R489_ANAIG|nr:e3 ubiquitin-protein ligase trim37 [Anaeramoeba ignava]